MSVFTYIPTNRLRAILYYNFHIRILYNHGTYQGTDNTNIFIHSFEGNKYVLTLFESMHRKDLLCILYILSKIQYCSFGIPNIVRSIYGRIALLLITENKFFIISNHITGFTMVGNTATFQLRLLGQQLALFHKLNKIFVYQSDRLFIYKIFYQYRNVTFHTFSYCHGDLFRDNIFFNNPTFKKIVGVIDIYYSCTHHPMLDLCTSINDWCVQSKKLYKRKIITILRSYHRIKRLSQSSVNQVLSFLSISSLRTIMVRLITKYIYHKKAKGFKPYYNLLKKYQHIASI
ncbi:phosphotransferase [Candidatus Vidania fulgoroideorum]